MTVRVMSAGLPTTRYEDQSSPVLDGLGHAAQTLLELGPKLGQIKLERDRLALDQQRENRASSQQTFEEGRQSVADESARVKAAPGNFTSTPSPYNNALAEQTQTENASKGIAPTGYTPGLPHAKVNAVPLSGFASALDVNHPNNPFTAQDFNNNLQSENTQNEQSHQPVQSRAGTTYEDTMRIKQAPMYLNRDKLNANIDYHNQNLGVRQQMADAATERADAAANRADTSNDGFDQRFNERIAEKEGKERQAIKNSYKVNDPYNMQTPQQKQATAQQMQKDLDTSAAKWAGVRGDPQTTAAAAPPVDDENAVMDKLLKLNAARKGTP